MMEHLRVDALLPVLVLDVGFELEHSRAGFTYLMYGVCFPIYYTTIALAVASMSPTAEIAGLMFSFLFSFVLTL